MIIERQEDVTTAVLSEVERAPDARFREVLSALVRHLHAFAREVRLTEEELRTAAAYVVALGQHSDDTHNEAILMAGSLGLSSLVCLLNNGNTFPNLVGRPELGNTGYQELGTGGAFGISWAIWIMVLFALVAWFVWRQRGRGRNILLLLTVLPLFMSYIVKLYALRAALGLNGLLNQALVGMGILAEPSKAFLYNQRAVLMTMTVIFLPFVILPVFISLERIPFRLLEASYDLGAAPLRTFRRVVLPLSLPGTVAGALFVFVLAMGLFPSYFLGLLG